MSQPTRLKDARVSALEVDSSRAALIVHSVDASGSYVSPGAGSTQVSIKEILSSSGGSLVDSTNVSLGVTIRAGSAAGTEYTDGDVDATPSGQVVFFDNSSNTMRPVTAARGLPVNIVAGSASSTEATVRQSTYTDFNTLSRVADRDASTNIANVTNTTPASTAYALAVREVVAQSTTVSVSSLAGQVSVGEYSTTAPAVGSTGLVVRVASTGLRVINSSAVDLLARVNQGVGNSSAADEWLVKCSSLSTGHVTVDTGSIRVVQSSAAELLMTATIGANLQSTTTQNSGSSGINVRVIDGPSSAANFKTQSWTFDSTGGGVIGSTAAHAAGINGLAVREVYPTLLSTTTLITSTHSTALYSLISSAAVVRQKVYAYYVGSTHTNPSTLVFMSSNAIDRWHVNFGSGSSGITGANLALSPPAWIFHADANNALNVRIEGGSSITATVVARVSISYFSEA
jgi:hypothetical protein